ncbi:MAG: urease accessory protein UreD [Thermaerobacter sp.]|nr:urease accessory protein UreD [Thermaerobacter sp.]
MSDRVPAGEAEFATRYQRIRVVAGPDGDSLLTTSFAQAPLKLFGPHPDHRAIRVVMAQLGGVLQGDSFRTDVEVGERAGLVLTTQAATKLYRMPDRGARHDLSIRVAAGGTLIYLPDVLIPFAGARYQQVLAVEAELGSRVLMRDLLAPGRLARGERFAFSEVTMSVRIGVPGVPAPLYWERQELRPGEQPPSANGAWGAWPYLGSLVVVEPGTERQAEPTWVDAAWQALLAADPRPGPYRDDPGRVGTVGDDALYGGLSRIRHGWVVRVLARRADRLAECLAAITAAVRGQWDASDYTA